MTALGGIETIVAVVSPYLGENMARASVSAHCRKLGINGSEPTGAQLDALVEKLALGLNIFLGRTKTGAVVDEIRRALATRGSAA
jgi:hypothetical protein